LNSIKNSSLKPEKTKQDLSGSTVCDSPEPKLNFKESLASNHVAQIGLHILYGIIISALKTIIMLGLPIVFIVTMNRELMFTGIFISGKDRSSQPLEMM
jgi:hypothetical protein